MNDKLLNFKDGTFKFQLTSIKKWIGSYNPRNPSDIALLNKQADLEELKAYLSDKILPSILEKLMKGKRYTGIRNYETDEMIIYFERPFPTVSTV